MAVNTSNAYGKISINDLAIAKVASHTAIESYGIVGVYARRSSKKCAKHSLKESLDGIKVFTSGNRIYIDVSVVVKYGVSIDAVADSLKEAVKYKLERFTGMIVNTVNVNVVGVKR
ncbi:MAG: Asp23/Gls24 family envelope stress response protein [Clostridia bacterium]|nr:Asp23/Gls24 family envelope stress response protein [Clostridia bacterium]